MTESSLSPQTRRRVTRGIRLYLMATVVAWIVPSIILLACHKSGPVAPPSDFVAAVLELSLQIPIVERRHLAGGDFNDGRFRFFALAYLKMAATLPVATVVTVLLTLIYIQPLSKLITHPVTGQKIALGSVLIFGAFFLVPTGASDGSTSRFPFKFTDFDVRPGKLLLMDFLTYGFFLGGAGGILVI